MAQIFNDGKAICRWCKEPLSKKDLASATRPREVHTHHVTPRKNALASGRWTRQMDDATTAAEAELLKRRASRGNNPLSDAALILQGILADFHTLDGPPPPELVSALVLASARLVKSLRGDTGEVATG